MLVIPIPDIFIQVFSHEGHVNNKICSIFIPISDSMNIEHFETKNGSIFIPISDSMNIVWISNILKQKIVLYGQLTNTFSESANN